MSGGVLTREAFDRLVDHLKAQIGKPRPPHTHLVSSRIYEDGVARCIDCGAVVKLGGEA